MTFGYIAQCLGRLAAEQQVPGSNPGVPFCLRAIVALGQYIDTKEHEACRAKPQAHSRLAFMLLPKRTTSVRVGCRSLMQQTPWSGGPACTYFACPSLVPKHTRAYKDNKKSKIESNQRLIWSMDSLAEWSKALAPGASPQGRGFEPHSCHWVRRGFLLRLAHVAKLAVRNDRAHGVVVSHPLSKREALGSIPSVSKFYLGTLAVYCTPHACWHTALFVHDSCGVLTHALADWRLQPAP